MRQIILGILGLALIGLSFMGMKRIIASKNAPDPIYEVKVANVFTQKVKNKNVIVNVKLTGRLEAVQKVDLFSETQGIFTSSRNFRPGTYYNKGDIILSMNSEQERSTLKAQRSTLVNQIVRFLPDLKFDYPEAFPKWEAYVSTFDVNKRTQPLPNTNSEREKFFIAGQNILPAYYNIKTLESRISKYRIRAPFSGILSHANVNSGALVSPGQKLGTFVGQNAFELALPIREKYISLLKIGQILEVVSSESKKTLSGKLIRINPAIDPNSQSITAYVSVHGGKLREGMFFEANLPLSPLENTFEMDRKLLVSNQFVYAVQNGKLKKILVTPLHYNQESVVVSGLQNGEKILSRLLPGARENMEVTIINQ